MSAFTLTMFLLFAFGAFVTALHLVTKSYPRDNTTNMGTDVVSLIVNISALAWAAYLYWGQS